MAKNLKLSGLSTYTNPLTTSTVAKGQVARFDDHVAERLLGGSRLNGDGESVPYWVEVADGAPVTFDFSAAPAAPVAAPLEAAAPASSAAKAQRRTRSAATL